MVERRPLSPAVAGAELGNDGRPGAQDGLEINILLFYLKHEMIYLLLITIDVLPGATSGVSAV